ncbi:MAG: ATP-binding protein [Deltaproteobacteria bacterium]|nr:ATP-binding protein [Deltaproteobacteria bacterium]
MLRDIVLVQKRELESRLQERYVERKIPLPWDLGNDLIKVITGPRRAGKSFYAVHLLQQAGSYGYVNFDDERLTAVGDYDEIVSAVNAIYGNPRYLLLDEIQNLPRWEMFANRLQRQGFRLLITGSNANLLSSELATHLTGRHAVAVLFPFSFGEYLATSGDQRTEVEKKDALDAYAEQGGYPEPLLKKIDRRDYLRTLLQSTLYKDIVKRYKIRSVQGIEDLALYLMSNIAREYSFNTLSGVTKCRSVHTVEKYIRYLQEAYLVFSLPRFSFKLKDQAGYNKKNYCTDNGLTVSAGFRFSADRGALYENLVAVALKKQEIAGWISLFYWKSPQNEEVDFVIKEGLHISRLIQVCSDISNPKTLKREMRALIKASQELHCDELLLLNDRVDRTETFKWQDAERPIRLMPLWQWLEKLP